MTFTSTQRPFTHRRSQRRSGGVTLELILNLPIWLILLLGTLQFGQLNSNLQHVALAARNGAEEASVTVLTGSEVTTPTAIIDVVTRQLQTAGILGPAESPCDVIIEHNTTGSGRIELHAAGSTCTCDPPDVALLPAGVPYTRVTVCVPFTAVAPNLLTGYCLDMSSRLVQSSTTFQYEL